MKTKEIEVSRKHIKLRVVLTISFLAIAIAAFTIGIVSLGNNEEGYYQLEPDYHNEKALYRYGITGTFYFSGNSNKIKSDINEVKQIMSDSLLESYILFDEVESTLGKYSIADINKNVNSEVSVDPITYEVLSDALNKTHENKNYSIYSAPIFAFWERLASYPEENREQYDPANYIENREELEALVSFCKEDHINLELKDDYKAILHVSNEYLTYREENEITAPLLSLNVLKESYRLDLLVKELEKTPFTNGYIMSATGSLISLKDHENPVYSLYTYKEDQIQRSCRVDYSSPSCVSSLRRFNMNAIDTNYFLEDGTNRSQIINLQTGYGDNYYMSSSLFFKNNDIISATYLNYYLSTITDNLGDVLTSIGDNVAYAFSRNENEKILYITNNLSDLVTINSEIGYNLTII